MYKTTLYWPLLTASAETERIADADAARWFTLEVEMPMMAAGQFVSLAPEATVRVVAVDWVVSDGEQVIVLEPAFVDSWVSLEKWSGVTGMAEAPKGHGIDLTSYYVETGISMRAFENGSQQLESDEFKALLETLPQ